MKKGSLRVLVTAAGGNLGQAIVKALSLALDIEVVGCDMEEHGVGPLFVEHFATVPPADNFTAYVNALEEICRSFRLQAVVPGSTEEIAALSSLGTPPKLPSGIPVVCQPSSWRARFEDKLSCMHALNGSLPLAPYADGTDAESVKRLVDQVGFPLVVKSRISSGSKKVRSVNNQHQLEDALVEHPQAVVQQYVDDSGGEFSIGLFVCPRFSSLVAYRRELRDAGCSMLADLSEDEDVVAYARKFCELSGLKGSANLQVRKSRDGVRLLEVNPRFSSLVAVRAASGFSDAEWSVRLALGQNLDDPPDKYRPVRFERYLQESLDLGQGHRAVTEWLPKKTQSLTSRGTVLVIAAHPDDEILGCGGTMARLLAEGHDVKIAILGEGMTSRYRKREEADRSLLCNLREHSRRAADVLGVKDLFLYDLPDNRFDTLPILDVVKIVEELVQKHAPHTIFTHGCADLNVDHSVTHRAVLTATRPIEGHCVRNLYVFEVPSSTDWSFHRMTPSFQPNTFFNIESTIDVKKRAMACYETEVQDFPHPRSLEGLEVVARRWGTVVGCRAAEAFELVRSVVHV